MAHFQNQYHNRPFHGHMSKRVKMTHREAPMPNAMVASSHSQQGKMKLFKEFTIGLPESITPEQATEQYRCYKYGFMKNKIEQFFNKHQDAEWFRAKYRPTEIKKRAEQIREWTARRKEKLNEFIQKYPLEDLSLDEGHKDQVSTYMANFSLFLDGASLEELEDESERKKYKRPAIFLRCVHPSVEKAAILEFVSKDERFLRLALAPDPDLLEGEYYRRGWITYNAPDVSSIRDNTFEINNHKFNGREIKSSLNKEPERRVRPGHYWFSYSEVARADLKNLAKLLTHFEGDDSLVLASIKEHLIEETNGDEKVLGVDSNQNSSSEFAQDANLMKTIDKVILYLRLVYSYDYYSSTYHPNEEELPNKVGLIFCRSDKPSNINPESSMVNFIEAHKSRIDSFIEKPTLSEQEQKHLGLKSVDHAIEQFIIDNTIEKKVKKKGKNADLPQTEKYKCKITQKSFTSPEFVRKHIFNKCEEQLEEVRTEVQFFNNYVADPHRPI